MAEINAGLAAHGVALRAARGRQHRRGARRRGRRGLHGHRRHRQRRRAPAGRRPARQRHGRRAHDARHRRDAVEYDELEPLELKGKAEPVPAWEAVGLIAEHAVRRAAPARESPLVGRDDELDAARRRLRARRARGRARTWSRVIGEAGVGKSRLLREFEQRLGREPTRRPTVRDGRCLPYGSGHRLLGARRGAARRVRDRRRRLVRGGVAASCARYVADLLGDEASEPRASRPSAGGADRAPARHRRAARAGARRTTTPSGMREAFFSAVRCAASRRCAQRQPARARVRGHPLGRRRHARPDRAPRAVGARAADARLPGARRAARAAAELGRRPAAPPRSLLEPLTRRAQPRRSSRALLPDGATRGRCPRVAERSGGNPLFAEEMARRIAEEGTIEAAELPDTVQARAGGAARLARAVRAAAGAAGGGRRAHVLGGRARGARRAPRAATSTQALALAPGEGHPRARRRRAALAGERELAFKHVLIRDVAYGMLPKAVRVAEALRGRRASSRSAPATAPTRSWRCSPSTTAARRRSAARAGVAPQELEPMRDRGAALPRGGRRRRGAPVLEPRGGRALPARARDRRPTSAREAACGSARSWATCRCGSGRVDEAIERLGGVPRLAPRPGGPRAGGRPAPQDRRGAVAQGRAQGGDRALPEGHQPAEGRPAAARARAPVRGGGLAVPAHRRQHARHLRLREGAAAGRAARGDARGQPRARDLRPRLRPHRRHREGAREPRARRGAGARLRTTARRSSRCRRSAVTSRSPRPT